MEERIKLIRNTFGETQEQFAQKIGVSKISVAYYESGKRSPSPSLIEVISSKYGINKNWLRTGEGEMIIPRTRDEEIAAFIGSIQCEDSFKNRFIAMLAKLDESEWEVLEHMAELISSGKDKDQE